MKAVFCNECIVSDNVDNDGSQNEQAEFSGLGQGNEKAADYFKYFDEGE